MNFNNLKGGEGEKILVMSSKDSVYFASLIARGLWVSHLTDIERREFGDHEQYYRIGITNRRSIGQ